MIHLKVLALNYFIMVDTRDLQYQGMPIFMIVLSLTKKKSLELCPYLRFLIHLKCGRITVMTIMEFALDLQLMKNFLELAKWNIRQITSRVFIIPRVMN